eukprot:2304691-Amphidinium_carterae.1
MFSEHQVLSRYYERSGFVLCGRTIAVQSGLHLPCRCGTKRGKAKGEDRQRHNADMDELLQCVSSTIVVRSFANVLVSLLASRHGRYAFWFRDIGLSPLASW